MRYLILAGALALCGCATETAPPPTSPLGGPVVMVGKLIAIDRTITPLLDRARKYGPDDPWYVSVEGEITSAEYKKPAFRTETFKLRKGQPEPTPLAGRRVRVVAAGESPFYEDATVEAFD